MRIRGFRLAPLLLLAACHRAEPPGAAPTAHAAAERVVAPALGASGESAAPSAYAPAASAPPSTSGAPVAAESAAAPSAPAPGVDSAAEPSLLDEQGKPLPQTEDRPAVSSASFQRRIQLVADAIRSGDPDGAKSAFFPLVAYQAVKDVQKPERDYRFRLLANFARDVKAYHKELGRDAAGAVFLGIEVPEAAAKWMAPGSEGNRLGYYRVLRSRLRFKLANGSERKLELTSLISWRGEWYVVHLHGFE